MSCFVMHVNICSYSYVRFFIFIFFPLPEIFPEWLEPFVLVSMVMVYILVLLPKYRNLIWLPHLGEFLSTHYFKIRKCLVFIAVGPLWAINITKHILRNRLKLFTYFKYTKRL